MLIFFILSLSPGNCPAQDRITSLPFRMANNLIVIDARVNDSDTMHFILDSGLKNSIICEMDSGEVLDLQEAREIHVLGLGNGTPLEAIHSRGNILQLGEMDFPGQDFMVLSGTVLQLSQKMGMRIHGLIGMQAFYRYVVEIDYMKQHISISDPGSFRYPRPGRYAAIPMQIEAGKPFIRINIVTDEGETRVLKLLLDSGASNAIWLDANSLTGFPIPEKTLYCHLGCGISGNIKGLLGRIARVDIGPYSFSDVLVSFPDSMSIARQEPVQGRNGSLGSEILKRFYVILDFPGKQILLRPNRKFPEKFRYDMSGMEIMAEIPGKAAYLVSGVREGSVADRVGVRPGDRIISIHGVPVQHFSLDDIYRTLYGQNGKRFWMEVLREGKKIKFRFNLEEYI